MASCSESQHRNAARMSATQAIWYLRTRSGERGPFTGAELREFQGAGKIGPGTAVRHRDEPTWRLARKVPGLFPEQDIDAITAMSLSGVTEAVGDAEAEVAVPTPVSTSVLADHRAPEAAAPVSGATDTGGPQEHGAGNEAPDDPEPSASRKLGAADDDDGLAFSGELESFEESVAPGDADEDWAELEAATAAVSDTAGHGSAASEPLGLALTPEAEAPASASTPVEPTTASYRSPFERAPVEDRRQSTSRPAGRGVSAAGTGTAGPWALGGLAGLVLVAALLVLAWQSRRLEGLQARLLAVQAEEAELLQQFTAEAEEPSMAEDDDGR